jgi:hypothetical protein
MSSDINFSTDDLNDSKSAAMKMTDSFYPNGKVVYTNTTQSREDTTSRTLTSADPVKILQGDGIYRNPAFSINGYIQNVQSSMHGVLATAGDIDDDVKIADPLNYDNAEKDKRYLTGAAARQEIAKQSLLSTGYAPGGFESTVQAMTASVGSAGSGSGSEGGDSSGTVLDANGNPIPHSAKGYTT